MAHDPEAGNHPEQEQVECHQNRDDDVTLSTSEAHKVRVAPTIRT
jgi:hypothetical protein